MAEPETSPPKGEEKTQLSPEELVKALSKGGDTDTTTPKNPLPIAEQDEMLYPYP
mgnify:FL=1